jgi:hypothetical protein
VQLSVTFPGKRHTDPRTTVTIREPGTPWPLLFHFLRGEKSEVLPVGFEIGERFEPIREGETIEFEPLDPAAVVRVASNYGAYAALAEQAIALNEGGIEEAIKLTRGPGKKPARLTNDFYRLIAADYTQRRKAGTTSLLKDMAESHHADESTVSRWVKRARELGYIDV